MSGRGNPYRPSYRVTLLGYLVLAIGVLLVIVGALALLG